MQSLNVKFQLVNYHVNIYLFKVKVETLEVTVKYVQR